jgi:hypothetical protein
MKEDFNPKQNLSEDLKTTLLNFTAMVNDTGDLVTKHAKIADCNICIITCETMVTP